MDNNRYFSHAWGLLTRDKGWPKPLLVMAAATLVPVAGALGNSGFALEWARLTAWGVDSAPKQKNVDVGQCIASGWRGFVVGLGWSIVLALVTGAATGIAGIIPGAVGALVAALVSLAVFALSAAWSIVVRIAQTRAAIYERIGAGYRVDRVFQMVQRDGRGFVRVFLINLVCNVIVAIAAGVMATIVILQLMPVIMATSLSDDYAVLSALAQSLVWVLPTCAVLGYGVSFLSVSIDMIMSTVVALWMRQFDVPAWGRSEDPLPGAPMSGGYAPKQPGYGQPAYEEPRYEEPVAPEPAPAEPAEAEPPALPQHQQPTAMDEHPQAPYPSVDEPVKDIDELYADLYDVIHRDEDDK